MAAQEPGPLVSLGDHLRSSAPQLLQTVVEWLSQHDAYLEFVALVREFLPDQERAILREGGVGVRVATFANHFRDRYFELPGHFEDGDAEQYADLTSGIPILPRGIGWEEYENLPDWASDYQVLAALCQNHMGSDDARIALLESCARWIPKDLLARTGQGYSAESLHERLDGTRYEPAALMADWLNGDTDNAFLDLDEETAAQIWQPWKRSVVEEMTRDWHQADLIERRISELGEWLLEAPAMRFSRLLNVIEGRDEVNPQYDPRQLRLPGPEFQPVET